MVIGPVVVFITITGLTCRTLFVRRASMRNDVGAVDGGGKTEGVCSSPG